MAIAGVQVTEFYLRDLLDNYCIPYLITDYRVEDGKKILEQRGDMKGATRDWTKMTYNQTQKQNKTRIGASQWTKLNVNLNKSPFVIIDIDIKKEFKQGYSKGENKKDIDAEIKMFEESEFISDYYFKTYSTGTGTPHYWLFKHEDDKGTTKTKFENSFTKDFKFIECDALYQNSFEKREMKAKINNYVLGIAFEYGGEKDLKSMCTFRHFNKVHKKKDKLKLTKKQKEKIVSFKSGVDVKQSFKMDDESRAILDNINTDLFDNYETWRSFVNACFNHFGGYVEAIEYSKKNHKYESPESVMKAVYPASTATFGTICYLSIQSNKRNHYEIRKKYSEDFDCSDSGLGRCFLEMNKGRFISQNEELYVLNEETNIWRVDKTKSLLYTTVQSALTKKFKLLKKKYSNQ